MAKEKKSKKKAEVKVTPAKMGYVVAIQALADKYDQYTLGTVEDELFPTPAKQKKVAVQIAKFHNRLVGKSKLTQFELLDEDLD